MTFSGKPKPLYFAENTDRFSPWTRRITHVVADDMPSGPDPWAREAHQRDAVIRGLAARNRRMLSYCRTPTRFPALTRCGAGTIGEVRAGSSRSFLTIGSTALRRLGGFAHPVVRGRVRLREAEFHPAHGVPRSTRRRLALQLPRRSRRNLCEDQRVLSPGIELASVHRSQPPEPRDEARNRSIRTRGHALELLSHRRSFPCRRPELAGALLSYDLQGRLSRRLVRRRPDTPAGRGLPPDCRSRWSSARYGLLGGKSTIAIAQAYHPEPVIAVDTWAGNSAEDPEHVTVRLARERDIFEQFKTNVAALTAGNVRPERRDSKSFLDNWSGPIKFAHIDASHEYRSVRESILGCMRWLVPGGVLCGDDFLTACRTRVDLDGGVERALTELLSGFEQIHNFWSWRKPS